MEPTLDTPPDDAIPADSGPVSGLFKSLTNLLAKIIAIAQTRLELLTTELQEEMHRVAEILVWTIVALLAAGMGLFLASLAIIFAFWDTHRVLASVLVTAAFFAIAIVAAFMLRDKVRSKPPTSRRDARRACEGSRAADAPKVMSNRVRELAEREAALLLRCAAQRRALGARCSVIEARLQSVDRVAAVARSTLLNPVVIVGGLVTLLALGRTRELSPDRPRSRALLDGAPVGPDRAGPERCRRASAAAQTPLRPHQSRHRPRPEDCASAACPACWYSNMSPPSRSALSTR